MTARMIFIEFMARNGVARTDAANEFDSYLTSNGRPVTLAHYLTVRRTGATMTVNRAERRSIYLTFENAQNHAAFEA